MPLDSCGSKKMKKLLMGFSIIVGNIVSANKPINFYSKTDKKLILYYL